MPSHIREFRVRCSHRLLLSFPFAGKDESLKRAGELGESEYGLKAEESPPPVGEGMSGLLRAITPAVWLRYRASSTVAKNNVYIRVPLPYAPQHDCWPAVLLAAAVLERFGTSELPYCCSGSARGPGTAVFELNVASSAPPTACRKWTRPWGARRVEESCICGPPVLNAAQRNQISSVTAVVANQRRTSLCRSQITCCRSLFEAMAPRPAGRRKC